MSGENHSTSVLATKVILCPAGIDSKWRGKQGLIDRNRPLANCHRNQQFRSMRLEERTITICDEKFLPFATMDYTQS
jgi:hypothetical protein